MKVSLLPAYKMIYRFNIGILLALYAHIVVFSPTSFWSLTHIASATVLLVCALVYHFRQATKLCHLLLNEGELGACRASKAVSSQAVFDYTLCEQASRQSYFGCWLAFSDESTSRLESPLLKFIRFLFRSKITWVFVPKWTMTSSEYKCLCRQLIWHGG